MPDRVSIVTRLILDRPTCLACIATKSGLTVREVEVTLDMIADALRVYREADRCLVCEETKEVASVKRVTPVCPLCAAPILGADDKTIIEGVDYHFVCWSLKTRTP